MSCDTSDRAAAAWDACWAPNYSITVTSDRRVQGEYRRVQKFVPGTSAKRCVFTWRARWAAAMSRCCSSRTEC